MKLLVREVHPVKPLKKILTDVPTKREVDVIKLLAIAKQDKIRDHAWVLEKNMLVNPLKLANVILPT